MPEEATNIISDKNLEIITNLFWLKGLNLTSIDDIVLKSGISRGTIYKYFDDKVGLFIQILQQYLNTIINKVIKPIEKNNNGLKSLIDFFMQFKSPNGPFYRKGCLIIQTAINAHSKTDEINDITSQFHKKLERCFNRNIQIAIENNELPPHIDVEKTKDFLIGNLYGILTLLRAKISLDTIINHVDGIIYYLKNYSLSNTKD